VLLNRSPARSLGVIDAKAFNYQIGAYALHLGMRYAKRSQQRPQGIKGQGMSKLGRGLYRRAGTETGPK
jgi:hypothetical protein